MIRYFLFFLCSNTKSRCCARAGGPSNQIAFNSKSCGLAPSRVAFLLLQMCGVFYSIFFFFNFFSPLLCETVQVQLESDSADGQIGGYDFWCLGEGLRVREAKNVWLDTTHEVAPPTKRYFTKRRCSPPNKPSPSTSAVALTTLPTLVTTVGTSKRACPHGDWSTPSQHP